jgi:PAS domain S-box-containing protein
MLGITVAREHGWADPRATWFAAAAVTAAGLVILAGWALPADLLRHGFFNGQPLTPWTAIVFVVLGTSLAGARALGTRGKRLAALGYSCVLAVGGALVLEHLLRTDLGLDLLWFPETFAAESAFWQPHPGRPTLSTCLAYVFVALMGLGSLGRGIWAERALTAAAIALIVLLLLTAGLHVFAAQPSGVPLLAPFGPYSALVFTMAALGILSLRPDASVTQGLLGAGEAARVTRFMLVSVLVAPLGAAWLALAGEKLGYYGAAVRDVLIVASVVIGFLAILMNVTLAITRAARGREAAEESLERTRRNVLHAHELVGIRLWSLPETGPADVRNILPAELMLPQEERRRVERALADARRDNNGGEIEFCASDGQGRARWLLARCWTIPGVDDRFFGGLTVDITDRREAERALRETQDRYHLAIRALRGYIYEWDCLRDVVTRSEGFSELLRAEVSEVGTDTATWASRIHPDDVGSAKAAKARALEERADSFSCEYRVRRGDGEYVWVWDHGIVVRSDEGQPLRIVGNVVPIHERKAIEQALAQSEHRLSVALSSVTDIVTLHAADGRIEIEQPVWGAVTGQPASVYRGLGWLGALHSDDARRVKDTFLSSEPANRPVKRRYRLVRRDGSIRQIQAKFVPVHDADGRLREWVGVHADLTVAEDAQRRLQAAHQRLEVALDAAEIGMWDWDVTTDRLTWSRRCYEITGLSVEAFPGTPDRFKQLLLPEDRARTLAVVRKAVEHGTPFQTEFRFRRADGVVRWGQNRAVPIVARDGRVERFVGTLIDVTLTKEFEQQREAMIAAERAARASLEQTAQMRDDFLSTISHELRTPLNAILGWTMLLRRPRADAATIEEGLRVIERNARAQERLISDLFESNRIASGKLGMEMQPLDGTQIVRAAVDAARPAAERQELTLRCDLDLATPLILHADPTRLQQVFANLLSNAIKFTPKGGRVGITMRAAHDSVEFAVTDSGPGIEESFLPHVFERFRQADRAVARRQGDLGLGLWIARQIVEAHGGEIAVDNVDGGGARFRVRLPRPAGINGRAADETGTDRALPALRVDGSLEGLAVLVVDDEADAANYLARLLAEQGASVTCAGSADEALDALRSRNDIDLLVSDIGMPGGSGYDLIRAIREDLGLDARRLPAVAVTAFARDEDALQSLRLGFQDHLRKPVEIGMLIAQLRRLTGRGESLRTGSVQ